jgi:hypothetical protein
MQIPSLAPTMQDYLKYGLTVGPMEMAKLAQGQYQFGVTSTETAAHHIQEELNQRANAAVRGTTVEQDSNGNYFVVDRKNFTATPVTMAQAQNAVASGQSVPGASIRPTSRAQLPGAAPTTLVAPTTPLTPTTVTQPTGPGVQLSKVSPDVKKEQYGIAQLQTNAKIGLGIMDEIDNALAGKSGATPTSSGMGTYWNEANAFFGRATPGAVANAPIDKLSAWLATTSPTGNQRTDLAREQAIKATGDLANTTKPLEVKLAAAATVRKSLAIMADPNSYAEPVTRQPGTPPPLSTGNLRQDIKNAAGMGSRQVNNIADYEALPSGATYTDPKGVTRTKR